MARLGSSSKMMSVDSDKMPTFFVIGAAKCGTTSLHEYLDLHPDISMSSIKEPMFFVPEDFGRGWKFSPLVRSKSEYLGLFDPECGIRGESSTVYSAFPNCPGVAERIHREVPDARLVYLTRDPIERAAAWWVQTMTARLAANRNAGGLKDFREMVLPFDAVGNYLTWPGMYATQIRQYLEFFPKESILVIDSSELEADREAVLAEVFRFIGADPDFTTPGFSEKYNTHAVKKMESSLYVRLSSSKALRKGLGLLPEQLREHAIERVRSPLLVPSVKPEIDPEIRRELEQLFRPEVEELREFTGKSFSSWSI